MTYIKVKPGVDMSGLSPKIWKVANDIADIFDSFDVDAVITSAFRPKKPNSLHHGFALDFRANHLHRQDQQATILGRIKDCCGPDYDVILHGQGANIHFHVEYDPD